MSLAYISGSLMTADGRLKELNKIAFAGVILNVILNVILIKKIGVIGAAIATMITQLIMTIIQYYFVYRFFKIKAPWKVVVNFVLFIICVVIITILSKEYSPLPFYLNIGFGILISLTLAFSIQLIELKSFTSMLQLKITNKNN